MSFLGDDEWAYRPRRPSARHQHAVSGYHLDPNAHYRREPSGSLQRTRSTGHSPAPIVNVYNDVYQDANLRADSHSPPVIPIPPYNHTPDFRGRRLGDQLADELAEMRLERRMRSRSRGRSDASSSSGRGGRSDYYRHEMDRLEREKREIEQREAWKKEEARIKADIEIKRLKDEAKRAEDDAAQAAEKKRVIEEYERKQREAKEKAKEEELRIIEKMERDKREAKEEEKRLMEKIEREKREEKEREEREWAEFERKRKEKQEKEDREKKEAQEKLDEAMRKRLAEKGFTHSQIEAIMDKEKAANKSTTKITTTTTTTSRALAPLNSHVPVYAKIHVNYLSTETLRYYDIPWEYDRVSQSTFQLHPFATSLTRITERPLLHHHPARDEQARDERALRPHESAARRPPAARRA